MHKFYDTKEPIPDKSQVFMVYDEGGKNPKYFKSKEDYELWAMNTKYRKMTIDYLAEILGYTERPKMKIPTIIPKKIEEYRTVGLDVLYNTFMNCEDTIMWALQNKEFKKEFDRISYIFSIIQNCYIEEFQKKKAREKEEKIMMKPVDDPNIDYYDNYKERNIAVKDISQFLDDDE